ncbi:MAG: 16S rRNA (uracil(1498)-N(3))-methyltransferase [Ramlibacter sp.]
MPRFHCPAPLASGASIQLPEGAARHAQVLRLQPASPIVLFNGEGGEFDAVIEQMGRNHVRVLVGEHHPVEREAARQVHLAVGMPANERMDWLVEKAAELGVASIQPLVAQRSVLKLKGERADRKRAHWQGICVAACEQSSRNRVPPVHEVMELSQWLTAPLSLDLLLLLSLAPASRPLAASAAGRAPLVLLSGPEGGLTPQEEEAALAQGFSPVNLGARVLRADTAPLAALAALVISAGDGRAAPRSPGGD